MKTGVCVALLCASVLGAGAAFAQVNTGRISGTVADHTGAVIPGASIVVTNQDTQLSWKATTDHRGFYIVTSLPVGTYSVEAEAPGFRKARQTGYDLADPGRITADFKLEVGAVTESVTVREVLGETVNTVSGELGHVIDSEQVQDLALNGRNYLQLVSLVPGVALLDEDQMALTTSLSVTGQSVNGTRTNTSNLMVDGGMNRDSGSNGSQINNVGVDFIREMSVQTSAMSAEYGRSSGASINAVTKSGGTKLHGGLLYTIRNDYLDAKDYFAPEKPVLRFHDYGWNLGGPIVAGPFKKGKLFFFGGQEWKNIRRFTSPTRRTLPTLAEIAGDFSDRRTTNIYYPGTRTPIPDKNLAPLMTPDSRAVMSVYGEMIKYAALYTNLPASNNAIYQVLNPFNWRQDIARLDYRPTDSHSIYFRWLHDRYDLIDPFGTFNSSQLPSTPTARNRPGFGPQLGDLWTVSAHVINEAKLSTSWNGQRTPLQGANWQRAAYGFQFPLIFGGNGPYPTGIPDVTVSSFASFNGPARVYLLSPTTDIAFSDNLIYMRGSQIIKTGVMIIRNRKDQNGRSVYNGSVNFNTNPNNNTSNYALADAALGNFSTYSEAAGDPVGFFRFSQYEAYLQNDWRVARRLTLNLGLRYGYLVPTYTAANNILNFDPSLYDPAQAVSVTSQGLIVPNSGKLLNGLIRAGDGVPKDQLGRVPNATDAAVLAVPAGAPRGLYPSYHLWMPRFGFAWVPFKRGKTSVRGGFGSFHDRVQGNLVFSQTNIAPYSDSIAYESGSLSNPAGGTVSARAVLGSINAIDPRLKVPVVYSYSLNLEQQLPAGLFLRLAYAGNLQRHLLRQPDINFPSFEALAVNYAIPSAQRPVTNGIRPYKGYSTIRMFLSDANGSYNSLQTFLSKRKGRLVFTVSHTWSHALADSSGDTDNQDSGIGYVNRSFFYGPPSFDRRHLFVTTYTYRLPLLARRRGFLGGAFGRWEISGVTRAQSGPHLTPVGSATGVTRRADYVGDPVALPSEERTPNRWFNTAAFKTASSTALGNAGVGTVVGRGLHVFDVTLRKVFRIHEAWNLRFEANAFNLLNHPNFRSLSVTTTSADYGSFTACGPARQIQGGVRLQF